MIRDQFKDVKKVTTKEARKKASMGERAYYSKRISRLQDLKRSVGLSMVITTVIMAIAYVLVLLIFLVMKDTEKPYEVWKFVIWSVVFGSCFGFTLVWYIFLKPRVIKNIDICRHELERLNAKTLSKAAATYALYGEAYKKKQEQIHREEKEKIEKLAEQKAEESVDKAKEEACETAEIEGNSDKNSFVKD